MYCDSRLSIIYPVNVLLITTINEWKYNYTINRICLAKAMLIKCYIKHIINKILHKCIINNTMCKYFINNIAYKYTSNNLFMSV